MKKSTSFLDLVVWQKAHKLVLHIYRITKKYPKEETYNLVSQMRRAAYSVPMNIVEGYRKRGVKDKANYMNTGEGSIDELKYQLILSRDLEYISLEEYDNLYGLSEEVSRTLSSCRLAILKQRKSS